MKNAHAQTRREEKWLGNGKSDWKPIGNGCTTYEVIFDIARREQEIAALDRQMADPGFWSDRKAAEKTISRSNGLKQWVEPWNHLAGTLEDLEIHGQLSEEDDDPETEGEVLRELDRVEQ